jgi:hypothetical protein
MAPVDDNDPVRVTHLVFQCCGRLLHVCPLVPARVLLHQDLGCLRREFAGIRDTGTGDKQNHGLPSDEGWTEGRKQQEPLFSCNNPVHGIGRHDAHNPRDIPNILVPDRANTLSRKYIVDLHLAGMGVVANGAAGIDPDLVEADPAAGIVPGHQVPQRDSGKFRVGVPWQGFCLTIAVG